MWQLLDTLEGEKQIQLLEKKIALERETQAALDPEVGAAEVRAMQREIHRMRLRYAQLQKRQEMMIADMERAIYKRDNIEAKGKVLTQKKGMPPTKAALQKQTVELANKLKLATHDANLTQMNVLKLQEAQRERGQVVELLSSEVADLRGQKDHVRSTLSAQQQQQLTQRRQLARNHRLAHSLMAANEGTHVSSADPQVLQENLAVAEAANTRIWQIIDSLGRDHPQYMPQLSVLAQSIPQR